MMENKGESVMRRYTKKDILNIVEEEDVEFIRLQFTDMFGTLKNLAITSTQLEKALNNKCMFNGSSIEGFVKIEETDMYLYPDLDTFVILPWRPQQGKVARLLCDIVRLDGTPFEVSPRHILSKVLAEAGEMGYKFYVGSNCEFFLFETDEDGNPTTKTKERAGYFDLGPLDFGENARRDMVLTLEDMGFEVESSYHSVAPGQHKIEFKYAKVLEAADRIMTFKLAVRTIARRHGLHATFMPKPNAGVNGSGMHINMSFAKDGKNIFVDENDRLRLSKEAYYFIGGLLKHIRGMSAITNPLVNSYKRLVPGHDAPVYITWSTKNRNPLIRIPAERGEGTRVELHSPDSSSNPYLVLAVCLAAGLDGIRNQVLPPAELNVNAQSMTPEELTANGIEHLPRNLSEALAELEKDEVIKSALGEAFIERYIRAKKAEWKDYETQVSQWEMEKYLYRI